MIYHIFALISLSMCLSYPVEGFSVSRVAFPQPTRTFSPSSTCLFAKEAETEEAQEESADHDATSLASPTDILNSPAFLKRKLEVIQSDVAKVEEQIVAAKQQLEEGKAEWGHQFDSLEVEVRSNLERNEFQNSQHLTFCSVSKYSKPIQQARVEGRRGCYPERS